MISVSLQKIRNESEHILSQFVLLLLRIPKSPLRRLLRAQELLYEHELRVAEKVLRLQFQKHLQWMESVEHRMAKPLHLSPQIFVPLEREV